jgi:hypothetical protein
MQHFMDVVRIWAAHATGHQWVALVGAILVTAMLPISVKDREWVGVFVGVFAALGCIAIVLGTFGSPY